MTAVGLALFALGWAGWWLLRPEGMQDYLAFRRDEKRQTLFAIANILRLIGGLLITVGGVLWAWRHLP